SLVLDPRYASSARFRQKAVLEDDASRHVFSPPVDIGDARPPRLDATIHGGGILRIGLAGSDREGLTSGPAVDTERLVIFVLSAELDLVAAEVGGKRAGEAVPRGRVVDERIDVAEASQGDLYARDRSIRDARLLRFWSERGREAIAISVWQ